MSDKRNKSREIAVGDVHGRVDALDAMLEKISPGDNDILIFLGDYVDRGPNSADVLRLLMNFDSTRKNRDIFLMGNHEEMMLNWLGELDLDRNPSSWLNIGGVEVLNEYGGEIPAEVTSWLKTRLITRFKTEHGFFSHAGFRECADFYRETSDFECMWLRDEFIFSDYCYPKPVCVGHTTPARLPGRKLGDGPWLNYKRNVMFLDCGCFATGILAAYDVIHDQAFIVRC